MLITVAFGMSQLTASDNKERMAKFSSFMTEWNQYTGKNPGMAGAIEFLNANISKPMTAQEREFVEALFGSLMKAISKKDTIFYSLQWAQEIIEQAKGIKGFLIHRKERELVQKLQPTLTKAQKEIIAEEQAQAE